MSSDTSVRDVAEPSADSADPSVREGLAGCVLVVVAMAAAVLALVAPVAVVPIVLWLFTLLVVPGWAMVPRRAGLGALQWSGVVVALSLMVETFGYVAMLWTTFWHPRALAFVILVVSANVIAVRGLVPWWSRTVWSSSLPRRLTGAAIVLTVGGALALALVTSRRGSTPPKRQSGTT